MRAEVFILLTSCCVCALKITFQSEIAQHFVFARQVVLQKPCRDRNRKREILLGSSGDDDDDSDFEVDDIHINYYW